MARLRYPAEPDPPDEFGCEVCRDAKAEPAIVSMRWRLADTDEQRQRVYADACEHGRAEIEQLPAWRWLAPGAVPADDNVTPLPPRGTREHNGRG